MSRHFIFRILGVGPPSISIQTPALVYSGPTSAFHSDCVPVQTKLTDQKTGTGIAGQTIQFKIGNVTATATTTSARLAQATLTLSPGDLPNAYTVVTTYGGSNTFIGSSDSDPFTINAAPASPLGQAAYTGSSFFWTTGPSSSTATLYLSATIRDLQLVCAGDIRNARITFAIRNANGTTTPINGASNLPVGLASPDDKKVGTASAIVQYNIGNLNATSLDIAVLVSGGYTMNNPVYDTIVGVARPLNTGFIFGCGAVQNNADTTGYIAGDSDSKTDFEFDVTYNKGGSNPQGNVNLTVRSYRNWNTGQVGPILRTYKIKSTAISVLATPAALGTATFTSKCNITDVTVPTSPVSVDGGTPLQLELKDNAATQKTDQVAITIQRKNGGLWFALKWDGTKAVLKDICPKGEVKVN